MKHLFFIIFAIASIIGNPQAKAANCTNVTVTYKGGMPYDDANQANAWHVTRCGHTNEEYYYSFKKPSETVSLVQGTNLWFATPHNEFGYDFQKSVPNTPVRIECTCETNGTCGDCKVVSSQKTKAKNPSKI